MDLDEKEVIKVFENPELKSELKKHIVHNVFTNLDKIKIADEKGYHELIQALDVDKMFKILVRSYKRIKKNNQTITFH